MPLWRRWTLAVAVLPLAAGPGDSVPPATAAEGLERIAVAYADWPATRPLGECPLVDVDAIDDAMETAGIDARLAGWELSAVDTEPARAACRGEYVGRLGDERFPEVAVELTAVVVGAEAEDPATGCERSTVLTECTGVQLRDKVAVGVYIADRVFVDGPTTDAVLDEVAPAVIDALSGAATELADPLAGVDSEKVATASAGLAVAIADVEDSVVRGDCPLMDQGDLEAVLADIGIDTSLDDWGAATRSLGGSDAKIVLECGGDSDGDASRDSFGTAATVQVVAFDEPSVAADFAASVGLAEGGSAEDLPPGETVLTSCLDAGSAGDVCTAWWWRDTLVVGLWLLSDSERITAADAEATLVAVVPEVVDGLAAQRSGCRRVRNCDSGRPDRRGRR